MSSGTFATKDEGVCSATRNAVALRASSCKLPQKAHKWDDE